MTSDLARVIPAAGAEPAYVRRLGNPKVGAALVALFPLVHFVSGLTLPYIGSPEKLFALIALAVMIITWPTGARHDWPPGAVLVVVALFMVWGLVSALASDLSTATTGQALASIATKSVLVVMIMQLAVTRENIIRGVRSLHLVALAIISVNLVLILTYNDPFILRQAIEDDLATETSFIWSSDPYLFWIDYTVINNPNLVARILLLYLPFLAWEIAAVEPMGAKRPFLYLIFGLAVVLIFLTLSRTGVATLVVALTYAAYKHRRWRFLIMPLLLAAGAAPFLVQTELFAKRFSALSLETILDSSRISMLSASFQSFWQNPIAGSGPGSNNYQMGVYIGHMVREGRYTEVHNIFISKLVEYGAVGFALIVALVAILFFVVQRAQNEEQPGPTRDLLISFEVALVTFVLGGMMADIFLETLYWYVAGLGFALVSLTSRERAGRPFTPEPGRG